MKINMWKLLIAGLFASAALAGCEDNRNNFMVDDSISFLGTADDLQNIMTVSVYTEEYELPVVKNGKGLSEATAHIEVSETALRDYNTANGTDYTLLPSNCYEFTPSLHFGEKDIRKFVGLKWDSETVNALDPDITYVISFELSGNGVPVAEGRNRIFLRLESATASMTLTSNALAGSEYVFDGEITLNMPVPGSEVTINYDVDCDQNLVDAYNAANGTAYKVIPQGTVTTEKIAKIAVDKVSAAFSCKIGIDKMTGLFAGQNNDYLIPVRITSTTDGVKFGETLYLPLAPAEFRGTKTAPWPILEGEDICYAKDPNRGSGAWIDNYVTSNLFNGASTGGDSWIPWWITPNVYPITIVGDMGKRQAITKFRIEDTTDSQGAYLDYEIYLADEYDGENTQWTLVASGMREWDGIYTPPGTVGAVKAYDYPVQKVTTGRYLKFVIVKCESVALENRGKLGDVWCFGLE